ncbi:MAG: polysaccharide biosynthesis protein [Clostridia bacterium]|nr:polysaccharide biosynthesis protein [Clostridia bacterium]
MKRVMIVGAGTAGMRLLQRLKAAGECEIVGVVGEEFVWEGLTVQGQWADIPRHMEENRVEQVYLAAPEIENEKKEQLMHWCEAQQCELIIEPSFYETESRKAHILQMAQDHMETLLGRKLVNLQMDIGNLVQEKTILVTGAGGTIGSQLCRVLAQYRPAKLILMDIAEHDSLRIMQEVAPAVKNAALIIGSVTNEKLVRRVFEVHRPHIVFHAAAHKHVPLMESNLSQCMENNVFGTYCCAAAAAEFGAETFVLISSDKAAQPVSVMGKAKRICEIMMRLLDEKVRTAFCSVRFGNVIGSSGSVLQAFAQQIACGGPVMLTDTGMTRFFMTAKEAAQLVISAAFLGEKAHMYMLDMGKPVGIATLARRLLKIVGREDIPIVSTGKREGEKLTETLCAPEEQLCSSGYSHIFTIQDETNFQGNKWFETLKKLKETLFWDEAVAIRLIQRLILEKES